MTPHNVSKSSLLTIPPLACAWPLAKSSPMRSVSPSTRDAYSLKTSGMQIASPRSSLGSGRAFAFAEDSPAPRVGAAGRGRAHRAIRHAKLVTPAPGRYPLFAQMTICKREPLSVDAQRVAMSWDRAHPHTEPTFAGELLSLYAVF